MKKRVLTILLFLYITIYFTYSSDKVKKLIVLSNGESTNTVIEKYYSKTHEDVAVSVQTVNNDIYCDRLDALMSSQETCPDIVTLEYKQLRKYIEEGNMLDLSEIAAQIKPLQFSYTQDMASQDGKVYALTKELTPGTMIYRRSLAKKYFGTDDPSIVQERFSNFEAFRNSALELNKLSHGKCMITASFPELERVYLAGRQKPWLVGGKLYIDPIMIQYIEDYKLFTDKKIIFNCAPWSEEWYRGMMDVLYDKENKKIEVFSYFLPAWGLYFDIEKNAKNTSGDWAITKGPVGWCWGGNWYAIPKNAKNKENAIEFIKYLTSNEEFLSSWFIETGDYVNYTKLSSNKYYTTNDAYLSNQQPFPIWTQSAQQVNGNLRQSTDVVIENLFNESVTKYINNELSKKQMLEYFKKKVSTIPY